MTAFAMVGPDGSIEGLGELPVIELGDLRALEDVDEGRVLVVGDDRARIVFGTKGSADAGAAVRGALRLASAASEYAAHLSNDNPRNWSANERKGADA